MPRSSEHDPREAKTALLGVGRSVKVKKGTLAGVMERLSSKRMDPENVMVVFQDVPWENWSPAGGRMPHA